MKRPNVVMFSVIGMLGLVSLRAAPSASSAPAIKAGKLADFVVLNKDFLAVPDDEIGQIDPILTVVGVVRSRTRYRSSPPARDCPRRASAGSRRGGGAACRKIAIGAPAGAAGSKAGFR